MLCGYRRLLRVFLCAALVGCAPADKVAPVTAMQVAMGTQVQLTAWTDDAPAAEAAFAAAFAEFNRLENLMSTWREGSDVLRLNAAAGGDAVSLSPETMEVLQLARHYSELSQGKFDVTFGPLSGLWRFDQDQDNVIPDPAAVAARLPLIGWEDLAVDADAHTARLKRAGMSVHLGGIGKGYAVDRAAAILRANGLENFLIQAGGDMYAAGHPEGRSWRLGIQDPRGPPDDAFASLELTDSTFSTSGDYERYFLRDGRRYHHILDPDTGMPAMASRSVTIVARKAVDADALSTAVFVLGPDAGMRLIEDLPDVEGVIVGADNQVRISSGLKNRVVVLSQPVDAP